MGLCGSTQSEDSESEHITSSDHKDVNELALSKHHSNSAAHSRGSRSLKQYQHRKDTLSGGQHTDEDGACGRISGNTSCDGSLSSNNPKLLMSPKMEPQLMAEESFTPSATPQLVDQNKSEFQLKMERKRSEMTERAHRLQILQRNAFDRQVEALQSKQYRRLYDVFNDYTKTPGGDTMDIDGLTSALAVFGMIIDTNSTFQRHIFSKFDLDNEAEIRFDDFSATMACFVGNCNDAESLLTLFEIFDVDEDGYLRMEDFARIFLTQNQIAVVTTGGVQDSVYSKRQCLKQARKIMAQCDCVLTDDGRISFEQFQLMMTHRTETDMMIDHMTAPSISMANASVSAIPGIATILPPAMRKGASIGSTSSNGARSGARRRRLE